MSIAGDEQALLIQNSTNPHIVAIPETEIESSPSPETLPPPQPIKGGIFSKLKSKANRSHSYSRIAVMNSNDKPHLIAAQSEQLPATKETAKPKGSDKKQQPMTPQIQHAQTNYDRFVHDPESPSLQHLQTPLSHLSYSPTQSKDDLYLDLHSNPRMGAHQPRASAVNPISIPLHVSQRDITLTTDFKVPNYKHRTRRSFSQAQIQASSPTTSPLSSRNEIIPSFDKNIISYDEKGDDTDNEEKKATDVMTDEQQQHQQQKSITPIAKHKAENELNAKPKPPFLKKRNSWNDPSEGVENEDGSKKKVKKQLQNSEEKEKKRKAPKVFTGKGKATMSIKLKKEKSVFDAFSIKKEKKIDLSNIKNLPIYLKQHLNDDSADHAIESMLTYIRESDEEEKDYVYEQLVKDKEFIPRICNKLLSATDAKHNEIVCIWLYDFFNEQNPNARLFALQFIPCLIWCAMTRPPKCVSGVVAALLSLYKKECNIFDKLWAEEDNNVDAALPDAENVQYGVHNDHNIFPKFEMPDLDLPSIYHEPNTNNNKYKPTAPMIHNMIGNNIKRNSSKNKMNKRDIKQLRDSAFPALNQANLSTNLHLIYVALQVFNHYITRVSKPSICLEQMCAVIAKLSSSGIDASQFSVRFPDSITSHFAWEWKWYTEDLKEKQHEKYILPSPILSQFLSSIRYSLKQPKTRNIAKFALGQVHKRGHIDMVPEIILQTTSMLHSAFMDGLTF